MAPDLTIKIGHSIAGRTLVRGLTYEEEPTWTALAAKVEELFFIPAKELALSYIDEDNDEVVVSSQEELANCFEVTDTLCWQQNQRPWSSSYNQDSGYNSGYIPPRTPAERSVGGRGIRGFKVIDLGYLRQNASQYRRYDYITPPSPYGQWMPPIREVERAPPKAYESSISGSSVREEKEKDDNDPLQVKEPKNDGAHDNYQDLKAPAEPLLNPSGAQTATGTQVQMKKPEVPHPWSSIKSPESSKVHPQNPKARSIDTYDVVTPVLTPQERLPIIVNSERSPSPSPSPHLEGIGIAHPQPLHLFDFLSDLDEPKLKAEAGAGTKRDARNGKGNPGPIVIHARSPSPSRSRSRSPVIPRNHTVYSKEPVILKALIQQLTNLAGDPKLRGRTAAQEMNVMKELLPEIAHLTHAVSALHTKMGSMDESE